MALSITNSFDNFERALGLRAKRAEVLAYNISNADTPGFKARDFDFAAAMRRTPNASHPRISHSHHLGASGIASEIELSYRVPLQPSLDQNTVETHIEQAKFMDNAVRYQAALNLLNGHIRHLLTAATGR